MAVRIPGYWLPVKGRAIYTEEHGSTVMEKPQLFGLTKESIVKILGGKAYSFNDTDMDSGRGRLLIAAMKNGWVRIRGGGANISVQYFGNGQQAMKRAYKHLEKDAGPFTNISISDLSNGFSATLPFKDLDEAIDDGMFDTATTYNDEEASAEAPVDDNQIRVPNTANRDQSVRNALRTRLERRIGQTIMQEKVHATALPLMERWLSWKGGLLVEGMAIYQNLQAVDPVIRTNIRG